LTALERGERRRGGRRPFIIPSTLVIFTLLVLMIIGPIITAEGPMTGGGNLFRQFSYALVFFFTVWATGAFKQRTKLLAVPLSLILAIGWCWLSMTWAISPWISVRRLLLTTMIIWTIFLAVEDCGYDRTIKALMIFLAALLVVNFVAVAVWPGAIHQASDSLDKGLIGDWRGLLPQKNFTGALCAFTILIFIFGGQRFPLLLRLAVILATAFFLVRTQSKTSGGMLALGLLVGGVYWRFPPKFRIVLIPSFMIVGITAMMFWINTWDEVLGPFAKKDALTGRVQIWPHLFSYVSDHPLTGSGYGSFWNIGEDSPIYQYSKSWVSQISNGHNGYLDLLVQVGYPGLILALAATLVIPLAKLLINSELSRERGALLIALLVFCAGHNMTETSIFERDVIVEMFLMFALALAGVATPRRFLIGGQKSSSQTPKRRSMSKPRPVRA